MEYHSPPVRHGLTCTAIGAKLAGFDTLKALRWGVCRHSVIVSSKRKLNQQCLVPGDFACHMQLRSGRGLCSTSSLLHLLGQGGWEAWYAPMAIQQYLVFAFKRQLSHRDNHRLGDGSTRSSVTPPHPCL